MAYYNKKKHSALGRVIVAVLVLAVLAVGVLLCGYAARDGEGKWFKNSDFSTWHWADPADDESEDNVSLMSYAIEVADFEAYGISPQALEAKVITVDFTPANTTNKRVGWVCKWKNPYSTWANNKNIEDYLNFVPADNFGASATLAVLQPFGEPVLVTATSRANAMLSSTAQFDYVARYSAIWDGEDIDLDYGDYINVFENLYTEDAFTVVPESLVANVYISLDENLVQYINSNGGDCNVSVDFESVEGALTWEEVTSAFNGFNDGLLAAYALESGSEIYFSVSVEMTCTYTDVNGGKVVYAFEDTRWAILTDACLEEMATPPTHIELDPSGGAF